MKYIKNNSFFITLLLLLTPLSIILYIFLSGIYNNLKLEYKVNLKGNTEIKYQILNKELSEIKHDIYFLSDLYKQQHNQEIDHIHNHINLELVIESFSLRHSFYSQIRFLDLNGKEFLRVDNINEKVVVVPANQLQDKSNRYYYQNAKKLQNKEIYLSPFDLNVEHGKIETPYNPTLRIVMPLYKNNIKSGYIIINYKGEKLLEKLRSVNASGIKTLMVNNEGYYLISDNKSKEWSFMFDKEYTLEKDNYELWHSIKEENRHLLVNQSNINCFKYLKPIDLFNNKDISKRKWTIISYINEDAIANDFKEYLYSIFNILLFFIVLIILFSYVISLYIKRLNEYEEKAKISKHRLIEANKLTALGQMVENIAHQWRQPLATISMVANNINLEIALESKISNEDLELYTNEISEETQYLSKIIDELRHFIKISDEKAQLVSLKSMINKSIDLVSPELVSNHIKTNISISNHDILLKENEFIQVLVHIFKNSQDAMINNTQEEERYLFLNSSKQDNFIVITIQDSGRGITEEVKDRIFEPYFTTKHKAQGTGLSLYMAYQIITNSYNGSIEVNNVDFTYNELKLKGLEFSIYLPL